jgi:hypothetical protein
MGCLDADDVVRDATIEEMSQAVFSASPLGALGGYIIRPTRLSLVSAGSRQLAVGDSRGKKSAGEDLACDLKTSSVP